MILGLIAMVLSLIGIVGFYIGIDLFVYIGAFAEIIVVVVGFVSKQQRSPLTFAVGAVGGLIYALISGTDVLLGIALGICFESAIMGLLGSSVKIYTLYKGQTESKDTDES
jgi:hypothetical protein